MTLIAKIIEEYRWTKFARMRTLQIENIPGTFTVHLNDLENSLDRAMEQWCDYCQVHFDNTRYVIEDNIRKFKGDISHVTYTRPFTFNVDAAKEAIRTALQGHL